MVSSKLTPRSKHITVKDHFFRETFSSGEIEIERVDSSDNIADTFNWGLDRVKFQPIKTKNDWLVVTTLFFG